MKNNTLLSLMVICLLLLSQSTFAQSLESQDVTTQTSKAKFIGKVESLGEKTAYLKTNSAKRNAIKRNKPDEVDNFSGYIPRTNLNEDAKPKNGDALAQIPGPDKSFFIPVETILNFDGVNQNEAAGILPPDTNGDVGPDHYFQCTNGPGGSTIKIFDKEGNLVYGPASSTIFWEDLGLPSFGDPIVLYDQYTNTWMFSEFSDFGNNAMLIAYSETSDPLGDWNVYVVNSPSFPDYPKFGVWPEHLIITTNEFNGDNAIPIYVVDKMAMINGAADVDFVRLTDMIKFGGNGFQVAGAVDADGNSMPAAGTKPMVLRLYDDEWEGGQDQLELWEIDVDWANPAAATMTNIATLNTTPFESNLCDGNIYACVEQPSGTLVSALEQVMMHRTQYRNFGSYEAIVCNHAVDVTGDNVAGVRWYELRKYPGGDWEIYQEGTLGDGVDNRFMASCAMDGAGNMALGYAITGPDKLLSLRFSGRRSSDVLGDLTVDENEFITGASENQNQRWGDYSSMNVDPVDERTFWYTGEYMLDNGDWSTRIVTFQLKRDTIDVGPFVVDSPQSSAFLTNAEPVVVEFKNFGLSQQGNFDIGYSVNGSTPVVENINVMLDPDSTHTHTFAPTVDMSALGDYEFKIWTSLADDQNILNDTTRRTITQLTRWDAGISGVNGVENAVCAMEVEVEFVLTNYGQEELTSANINFSLNGGTAVTIPWTGALAAGESETVTYLITNLIEGTNTIDVSTSEPNGVADQDLTNDGISRNFEAIFIGESITLNLLTDDYGSETSWELADMSGTILFEGDGYQNATLYTFPWCIAEGCYNFTIYDSFGDGICCGWGIGNYEIVDGSGVVLASGGEFGGQETKNFCFPFECAISATGETSNESGTGANDGSILVTAVNTSGVVSYSLDGGTPQNSPVFNNVGGGAHTIVIVDGNGCEFTLELVVGTCAMQVTIDIVSPATSTSNDGVITVNVVNANEPVEYSQNGGATYQDSNVFENAGTGFFTIVVRDALGCIFFESIELSESTDTDDLTIGQSVEIFPNPTEGVIQVEIKGLDDTYHLNYEVYDMLGKRIHKGSINSFNGIVTGKIAIVSFPEGTYLLKFVHPDLENLHKIVKMK